MSAVWELTVVSFVITLGCIVVWKKYASASPLQLPPGPPPDILIGHARKLPLTRAWEVYAAWKKIYGDVIYVYALGRSIVILNSVAAARDLLEKKSLVFSDRPYMPVFSLMGWELVLPFLRYGPRFRKHRRIMHQHFGPQAIASFRPTQEHEIRKFLRNLLRSPDNFIGHIHILIAGIVVSITYGHEVMSENDAYVELVERAMHMSTSSGGLGTTIVDIFPFLRHVPAWLPGMGLKRFTRKTRDVVNLVMTAPLEELKAKRVTGDAPACFVSDLLDKYEETDIVDHEHEEDIMNIGATIYNAGTDTTKSTLTTFFMFMTLHPEIAKQAQEEIDKVVGRDRLPSFDDRRHLPYIDCLLKELYRIQPPGPIGLPHKSTQIEHYRGWTIPDGTTAIPNIWQMMRDETMFPNPEVFSPERYSGKDNYCLNQAAPSEVSDESPISVAEDDPSTIVFGFGRRACPGKHFADSTLWLAITNVLALFDIGPYTNTATGLIELPKFEFENKLIMFPKSFKCIVVPRNAKLAQMIEQGTHD